MPLRANELQTDINVTTNTTIFDDDFYCKTNPAGLTSICNLNYDVRYSF